MSERIQEEVDFAAEPARVYRMLTDASRFSAMTGGAPAEIDAREGGAFSCFGGMIVGRNVECVPGERLVQAWRAQSWEPGAYSIVRFELRPKANGTRLVFEHVGFPEGQAEHLASGWKDNYWGPLSAALAQDGS